MNAKENRAITADSLRIELLLNGFFTLMLEIICIILIDILHKILLNTQLAIKNKNLRFQNDKLILVKNKFK